MNIKAINKTYKAVKEILESARSNAYKAVNFAMVQAYWNIGRVIVEDEQQGRKKADYGKHLMKELSARLSKEFGRGFNTRNLWFMRSFYQSFEIMNAVRSQSSSTKKSFSPRAELPVVCEELSWLKRELSK